MAGQRRNSDKPFWLENRGLFEAQQGIVTETLNPGLYELMVQETAFGTRVYLKRLHVNTDNITHLPESLCEYLMTMIQSFWSSAARYTKMGLLHRRGVLLEGEPGCGKTYICLALARAVEERGGITILTTPNTPISALPSMLQSVRITHPNTPIVNVMEDIDTQDIDSVLPLLDGEHSLSNIVHLATTNFLGDLDARLTNRPSRFDEVLNVGAPNPKARTAYLQSIVPEDGQQYIREMVKLSKDLNFAQLKELAVCTYVYGRSVKETVERLKEMEWQAEEFENLLCNGLMGPTDKPKKRILTARRPKRSTPSCEETATVAWAGLGHVQSSG